jgi:hypothetical protein
VCVPRDEKPRFVSNGPVDPVQYHDTALQGQAERDVRGDRLYALVDLKIGDVVSLGKEVGTLAQYIQAGIREVGNVAAGYGVVGTNTLDLPVYPDGEVSYDKHGRVYLKFPEWTTGVYSPMEDDDKATDTGKVFYFWEPAGQEQAMSNKLQHEVRLHKDGTVSIGCKSRVALEDWFKHGLTWAKEAGVVGDELERLKRLVRCQFGDLGSEYTPPPFEPARPKRVAKWEWETGRGPVIIIYDEYPLFTYLGGSQTLKIGSDYNHMPGEGRHDGVSTLRRLSLEEGMRHGAS